MKRSGLLACMMVFMLGLAVNSYAKPRIYKWVKDKRVSSDQVLTKSQSSRVLPVNENRTLGLVKTIMIDELYMALGKYHKSRHRQDAESTPDSVLPEQIIKQTEVELVDDDYRFVLEVSLKKYGKRTRVTAKAIPVYRIRDLDAEAAASDESTEDNTVEVKIKAGQGGIAAVGPIIVAPVYGVPGDYGINPLPDANRRAAQLVRSFIFFLDKKVAAIKNNRSATRENIEVVEETPARESELEPKADVQVEEGTEVEIKVKTHR